MERGLGRLVIGGVVAALAISGCNLKGGGEDLVNGKELFVQECAACHVLERAGATGVTGPDLDAAFKQSRADGLGESTFRGVVEQQILHPNATSRSTRRTARTTAADAGQARRGRRRPRRRRLRGPGRGQGRATIPAAWPPSAPARPRAPPRPRTASLDIPVAAAGLAYQFADASARGRGHVNSENPQTVPHDIAVEGNGVNEKGEVVQGGGTSEFSANLQPGEYTFFCSVPGHREGGMEGKLTVK